MYKRRYALFLGIDWRLDGKTIEKVPTRSLVDFVDVLKHIHQ
jgi:hypothetical protein